LPGDPDNNSVLTATPAFGGIDVAWTYPTSNPQAVAHVLIYRGVLASFNAAIQIAVVSGDRYYDKSQTTQNLTYYYWIKIVSVNGTVGALIGPASAMAKPPIANVIEQLSGQINVGLLAQSLKADIDKITLNATDIAAEIANRISANNALSSSVAQVQTNLTSAVTLINTEITNRTNANTALVSQINTVAAANTTNAAAIVTETNARIAADSSLATQITTVQTSAANNLASVQTTLQTNITAVDGKATAIGARYTAQVGVNGLVGGFGVYNNGTTIEAGFDVNTFWIGSSQGNKKKPFIVDGGVVYIDEAAINKLTFTKLRDEAGTVMVANGKIKANYLQVNEANGGAYTGYAWPAGTGVGFHIGPNGLLLGNANTGKYFQVEAGGNVIAPGFTIINGSASFNGAVSAQWFSTVGGRFTADTNGVVTADLVDVRRRIALQSNLYDTPTVVDGTYINANGTTEYRAPGYVFSVDIADVLMSDIYDSNTQSASANQPYYVAANVEGPIRDWNGVNNTIFQFTVVGTPTLIRTYSNSQTYPDDYRIGIRLTARFKIFSGYFISFRLPQIRWTLYKL
jgi:hypothetical protein